MRRFMVLIAILAIVLCAPTQKAEAQFFGGYGAGFTPSPQASYGPNGAVTGVLYPNGAYVGSGGYVPPGPIYGGGAYGGMGYGAYGGYGRPMPIGQALVTSAAIVALSNRGYGGYGYGGGYGYQPYAARGFRGGYHHHHH